MEVVNGYPCFNCDDAAKAQRGIDPAARPQALAEDRGAASATKPDESRGINRPLAEGVRGTRVNLLL